MEYRDSKRLSLGEQKKVTFSVPEDLYFEGLEIQSQDLKFKTSDFATIDIDVSKRIKGTLEYLEITIQEYPLELEGVEIEISVIGSFDTAYVDIQFVSDFTDDFVSEWA
jgi:hypothetical protein